MFGLVRAEEPGALVAIGERRLSGLHDRANAVQLLDAGANARHELLGKKYSGLRLRYIRLLAGVERFSAVCGTLELTDRTGELDPRLLERAQNVDARARRV